MTTRVFTEGTKRLITVEECKEAPKHCDCPCCDGRGYHWSPLGRGPDADSYLCQACNGDGSFKVAEDDGSYEVYKVAAHNVVIKKVDYHFPGDDEDDTKPAVTLEITVANIEVAERLRALAAKGTYGLGIWNAA